MESLMVLKSLEASQKEISAYVRRQDARFRKLLKHVKRNRLKAGLSKGKCLKAYGEPVLEYDARDGSGQKVFLYRYATEYFGSPKVYLYFDQSKSLTRWEYKVLPDITSRAR